MINILPERIEIIDESVFYEYRRHKGSEQVLTLYLPYTRTLGYVAVLAATNNQITMTCTRSRA